MSSRYITFDSHKYPDLNEMFKDVSAVMQTLIRNDYEVLFRYDDCNIYVLEYCDSRDSRLGGEYFVTVNDEEYEMLQDYRYHKTDDPDE